jgi:hypothetical protein
MRECMLDPVRPRCVSDIWSWGDFALSLVTRRAMGLQRDPVRREFARFVEPTCGGPRIELVLRYPGWR